MPAVHSGFHGVWRSMTAGACGSVAHSGLMLMKSSVGFLPAFHPYEDLQRMLSELVGAAVPHFVPWALSFLNGSLVLGLLFGRLYQMLPGHSGAAKGIVFGAVGWIVMGVLLFPMLGQGLFATQLGLGLRPALFSLLMLLTYSIIMGMAYSALTIRPVASSAQT